MLAKPPNKKKPKKNRDNRSSSEENLDMNVDSSYRVELEAAKADYFYLQKEMEEKEEDHRKLLAELLDKGIVDAQGNLMD